MRPILGHASGRRRWEGRESIRSVRTQWNERVFGPSRKEWVMRSPWLKRLLLACAGLVAGCGGSPSTSTGTATPSPPPPLLPPGSVLSLYSGFDGAPVVGADVRVGAVAFRSDAAGHVVL